MSDDPRKALMRIRKHLQEACAQIGLPLENVAFVPAGEEEDAPLYAQAIFQVTPDAFKEPDEKKIDDEFRQIMLANKVEEDERKAQEAREGLSSLIEKLNPKEGLGFDEPDSESG